MSIINNGLLLASGADAATGYQISRSIRLNSADSAYFSRTPGSAGNRKTWTWSGWVKRTSSANSAQSFFSAYIGSGSVNNEFFSLTFANDAISVNGYSTPILVTSSVYRDFSAWYHVVLAVDTTNGTSSERVKLWVNGVLVTAFQSTSYPSLNADLAVNLNSLHTIGKWSGFTGAEFDGYLADIYFLDGTATTPSTFAETDAITGQWVPKTPTGISYGTNGFRLTFSDNSGTTSTTLGKDAAGSNNWTPNNFSVASGSGNDSLVDSPTSYGTDTGAGGEVRGNYSTLNPLSTVSDTLSNGNLDWVSGTSASRITKNTIAVSTGKWYAEFLYTGSTTNGTVVGICEVSATGNGGLPTTGYMYYQNGNKYINSTGSAYGSSWANGDLIGIALNLDSNQVTFYKNNTSQGAISITSGLTWVFCCIGSSTNDKATWNFGARAFSYQAPSGYKALCDTNLTAPTIAKPANYFDVKLYTGNGGTQTISGLGFSPDLVWIKGRSLAADHGLFDIVRGTTKRLVSNATQAEDTQSGVTAFNSDGFDLGSYAGQNQSSSTYVAWAWDAAGSNTTDTTGSITSTRRTNATSGCSVVTYTGNGSAATVGHGLNALPSFFVIKNRSGSPAANNWYVGHTSITWTKVLILNTTDAASTGSDWTPTSTLLTIPSGLSSNGINYVAYCFSPVTNYSAFGSYTGNGSTDGPFVFTGFRVRWLMYKSTAAGGNWIMLDAARDSRNVASTRLLANTSDSEGTGTHLVDFLSNGFKIRNDDTNGNTNAQTYVWAAFAESPFQYARAR